MKYATFSLEKTLLDKGCTAIAGIDEAGRGCIAGPVVAAVVVISNEAQYLSGVWDSKLMSGSAREKMYAQIVDIVDEYAVGEASVEEVDQLGIGNASARAMLRAYECLSCKPEVVLIDGIRIKTPNIQRVRIKQGDRKHYVISAASVLAKVHRDRLMRGLSEKYPGYGFERHVGYGTREHIEAICRYGVTEIHRKTFSPVSKILREIHDQGNF